ncbi:MAG: PLP-dependent aminotransferase family protein [Colwellia sp.]|nr:PLP-dependent aminotransferase family protein [Colwellia sp.]
MIVTCLFQASQKLSFTFKFSPLVNTGNDDKKVALYLRVIKAIKNSIAQNKLTAGQKLPSSRTLAQQFGVARQTIVNALNELIAQDILYAKEKSGYFVVDKKVVDKKLTNNCHTQSRIVNETLFTDWQFNNVSHNVFSESSDNIQYNFIAGTPDFEHFPFTEFRRHLAHVMNYPDKSDFSYEHAQGQPQLITAIKHYLHCTRNITNRPVFITSGSQEAIFMISRLLLNKGDKVAVSQLGYQHAWSAFKENGATLIKIKNDQQNLDIGDLASKLKQQKIKLLYLTPDNHYPTTQSLSTKQREQIVQLAREHNVIIIEDDYDHEYHFTSQITPPMASHDPQQLIIYLSTFSKILYPGARIGFISAPALVFKQLIKLRQTMSHKNESMTQRALALWMTEGGFSRHILRSTKRYQSRRLFTDTVLKHHQKQSPQLSIHYTLAKSGLSIWLKLNVDCALLAETALKQGILIQDESCFSDVKISKSRHLRLGFSRLSEKEQHQGIDKLMALANDQINT